MQCCDWNFALRRLKMKIRDSAMPDEHSWERFFDARHILRRLGLTRGHEEVVDFGCGYGTFSIAAARMTTGTIYALDIERGMVAESASRARQLGLANVRALERDFLAKGAGLPASSVDYAMLFNILHAQEVMTLLREALRVLRPGGTLGIIHWIHDKRTPRGPPLSIRPRPEQCAQWAADAGFQLSGPAIELPPYHYGLVARKPLR
jgi:ubiquinone/menaquinone biosynthesis C-methylase UbiE